MAALEVLSTLGSRVLPSYLDFAAQDGRQYLVTFASRLRPDLHGPPRAGS